MKYKYIKIVHKGQDYYGINYAGKYYEVSGMERFMIEALLKKIEKYEK